MKKVDELTKNRRQMDRENISGHMPEDREMPEYCPVRNSKTSPSVQQALAISYRQF